MQKDLRDSWLYESRFKCKERKSNARFFAVIFAMFICFFSLRAWWTQSFGGVIVDGNSMKTTLYDGEKLLMRYADKNCEIKRGDIIVVYIGGYDFSKTEIQGDYIIKRLIAIEGDKVKCTDGQIEIMYAGTSEYQKLSEPYAYYGVGDYYKTEYDFNWEYEVGKGEIFFLGDNRSSKGSSVDSRYKTDKGSHLKDSLYKKTDIYGVVPDWAMRHQEILAKIFF